jgi:photosystem II stability/assembly factor-like uncharacterized protein
MSYRRQSRSYRRNSPNWQRRHRPALERLEDRALPSLSTSVWTPIGPQPVVTPGAGPLAGRITVAVADPTDPNIMYVAGDGAQGYGEGSGIWKTTDWLDPNPLWVPVVPPSLSQDIFIHCLAMAPTDHNTLYAATAGPNGGILKTTDGGAHWKLLGSSIFANSGFGAIVVSPLDANVIFVAAYNQLNSTVPVPGPGGLWESVDGGASFTNVTPSFIIDNAPRQTAFFSDLAISPLTPSVLWAGVTGSGYSAIDGVYRVELGLAPGQETWLRQDGIKAPTGQYVQLAIAPSDADQIVAAVYLAAASSTGDTTAGIPIITNVQTRDLSIGMTVRGSNIPANTTIQSIVGPTEITLSNDPSTTVVNASFDFFQPGAEVFSTGNTMSGSAIVTNLTDTSNRIVGMSGSGPGIPSETLIQSIDSPSQITLDNKATATATGVSFNFTTFLQRWITYDGGASWFQLTQPAGGNDNRYFHTLVAFSPVNPDLLFIHGTEGHDTSLMYGTVTPGSGSVTWTPIPTGEDVIEASFDTTPEQAMVLDVDRGVFRVTGAGTISPVFEQKRATLNNALFHDLALSPTDPGVVFGVMQDQLLLAKTTAALPAWQYVLAGDEIGRVLIDPSNSQVVYSYGPLSDNAPPGADLGFVNRSLDGGTTWQNASGSGAGAFNVGFLAADITAQTEVQAFAIDRLHPTDLVAGGLGIQETTDSGDSWTQISPNLVSPLPGDYVESVAFAPNGLIYAGTRRGEFLISPANPNSSTPWTAFSAPGQGSINAIAIDPANPNHIFIVLLATNVPGDNVSPGDRVLESTNGGQSWTPLAAGIPDQLAAFSLAVDWRNQTPVLYVGTDRGVFRSTDGGASWSQFGSGMPATLAFTMDLETNINVLAVGTFGRGAYEILVPAPPVVAAGADAGGKPEVRVFNQAGTQIADFLAFAPGFPGGVRVAVGDVNGDGTPDIIVAAGPGGGPNVKVIDGTKLSMVDANGEIDNAALIGQFYAYDPAFAGGLFVAFGEGQSGSPEIITGADAGGGPHVKVIDATKISELQNNSEIADAALIGQFYAYSPLFGGGVRVAAADVNGDGVVDVITGAGPGGGPHVLAIDGTKLDDLLPTGQIAPSALLLSFMAYSPDFAGGVYVAAGPVGTGPGADIITGAGAGGGPHVEVFSSQGAILQSFMAYSPLFPGGVRVGYVGSFSGGLAGVVLTGAGPGGGPQVNAYDAQTLSVLDSFYAFNSLFNGGVFVGGG